MIVCKCYGSTSFDFGIERGFYYTLVMDIKDEKLRVRYENVTSTGIQQGGNAGPNMNYQWSGVERYLNSITSRLISDIQTPKNEDW